MKEEVRQKTLGLSFAGGGVHAWGEVAVLEELERNNIEVTAVTGTSMGSFIAAAVASGVTSAEIYEVIRETDQAIEKSRLFNARALINLFSFRQPLGLVLMEKLVEVIEPVNEIYGELMLSDVPKPLAIPAVDLITSRLVIFTNDRDYFQPVFEEAIFYEKDLPLLDACLASSAYPVILSPVELDEFQLIDGGVLLNSPAALFSKDKLEYVLAVSAKPPRKNEPVDKRLDVALRTLQIVVSQQEEHSRQAADQYYTMELDLPRTFDFGDCERIIEAGQVFVQERPLKMDEIYIDLVPKKVPKIEIIEPEPATLSERLVLAWDRVKGIFQ